MKVYSAKCKAKKEMTDIEEIYATKSYRIIEGRCKSCGKKLHEILEKKKK